MRATYSQEMIVTPIDDICVTDATQRYAGNTESLGTETMVKHALTGALSHGNPVRDGQARGCLNIVVVERQAPA